MLNGSAIGGTNLLCDGARIPERTGSHRGKKCEPKDLTLRLGVNTM